jgi:hypothetical protein
VTANTDDEEASVKAFLAEGVERAWHLDESALQGAAKTVSSVEAAAKAIDRSCAVWIILISLVALL